MRVLVVGCVHLNELPPALNLVGALNRLGISVTLITKGEAYSYDAMGKTKTITLREINRRGIQSVVEYFLFRRKLRSVIKAEMKECDVLWTLTDKTVREVGNMLFQYKYIMQLQELVEFVPAIPKQAAIGIDLKRYLRNAYKVVVPEINRAHIIKAWNELDVLPSVLPNKVTIEERDYTETPQRIRSIMNMIEREPRRIVLYQGILAKDRDLEVFAKAINEMDDYVLYIMGKEGQGFCIDDLRTRYNKIVYIPYIAPPDHLFITSRAFIGLLPYRASRIAHLSVLNAVFCAPNKLYEYSAFGIPMIGSSIPGLMIPFEKYRCGILVDGITTTEIIEAIRMIEANYHSFSSNSKRMYNENDYDTALQKIVS